MQIGFIQGICRRNVIMNNTSSVILILQIWTIIYDLIVAAELTRDSSINDLTCIRYARTSGIQTDVDLNLQADHNSEECVKCNYVCTVDFLTKKTNFSIISAHLAFGLIIKCNREINTISELNYSSLQYLLNLVELRFRNCRFSDQVSIEEWVGNLKIRDLSVQNSFTSDVGKSGKNFTDVVLTENFYQKSQLDTMDLSKNGLRNLPTGLLCHWIYLLRFMLHHNHFSDLSFLYQPCKNISNHALPLQNVEYIDASYNLITEVAQELLISFPKLRWLSLRMNRIHTVGNRNLDLPQGKTSSLWNLDLSDNRIRSFKACKILSNTVFLDISSNPIQCTTDPILFQDCKRLVHVTMEKITTRNCNVLWSAVSQLRNVRQLSLSGSPSLVLHFNKIPKNLILLNANHSGIRTLSDINNVTCGSSYWALQVIDLERNNLSKLTGFCFPSSMLHINLAQNAITHIEPLVFTQCRLVTRILLGNNRLTNISGLFSHLEMLIQLELQYNNIIHFDYSMIHSFLNAIDLSYNSLRQVTDDDQRHFSDQHVYLEFLNVSGNHLITLTQESFAPSLINLDLSNCIVDSAHTDAFKNLKLTYFLFLDNMTIHNAQSPYLIRDQIGKGRHDFFDPSPCDTKSIGCSCSCPQVNNHTSEKPCCNTFNTSSSFLNYDFSSNWNERDLTYCIIEISCFDLCSSVTFYENSQHYQPLNKLFCTETGDFSSVLSHRVAQVRNQNFINQKSVMLNNMSISVLKDGAFENFQELVVLNLDKNFISKIQGKEFRGLQTLTKLYINENRIIHVNEYSLVYLHNLLLLELKNNNIQYLKKETFVGLHNLRRLYLSNNKLKNVFCNNFGDLKFLEQLDLSMNNLPKIRKDMFVGLSKLIKLSLQHNRVNHIDDYSFYELTQLRTLELEGNDINFVSKLVFLGLNNLQILNLCSNKISFIEVNTFTYMGSMHSLYLHKNLLRVWGIVTPPSLTNLTLSHNQFSCDCKSVFQLQEELREISTIVTDADKNRCVVQNTYLPNVFIQNMTQDDCYNGTVTVVQEAKLDFLLSVSVGPAAFLLLALCSTIVLYIYRLEVQVLIYSKFNVRLRRQQINCDSGKDYDAFLSYNSEDRMFIAKHLLPELEKKFRVCVHERDFPVGAYIADTIADVVENSCRTLVILTPSFIESEWCLLEFKYAHYQALKDKCCRLVIIVVEDVPKQQINGELRAYLRTNTFLRWGDPLFWPKLLYTMPSSNKTDGNVTFSNSITSAK